MSQNSAETSTEQKLNISELDQNITEFLTETENLEKIIVASYPKIFGAVVINGKNKDVYDHAPEIFKIWISNQTSESITTLKIKVKFTVVEFRCTMYGNCECGIYHGNKD